MSRYTKGTFSKYQTPTVAVDFCGKVVSLHDGTKVKAQIWDTTGQEKYKSLVSQHYRKALGAMLVFDLTKKESFLSIQRHLYDLRQWSEPDCVGYLIGNKLDLIEIGEERGVGFEYVKKYAEDNGLVYIETSALSDVNIENAFVNLLEDVNKVKFSSKIKKVDHVGKQISIERTVKHSYDKENKDDDCVC